MLLLDLINFVIGSIRVKQKIKMNKNLVKFGLFAGLTRNPVKLGCDFFFVQMYFFF